MRFKRFNLLIGLYVFVGLIFLLYQPVSKEIRLWWMSDKIEGVVLGVGTPRAEDDHTPVLWVKRDDSIVQHIPLTPGFDVQQARMALFRIIPGGKVEFMHYLNSWVGEPP